jgi:hypothetical protein
LRGVAKADGEWKVEAVNLNAEARSGGGRRGVLRKSEIPVDVRTSVVHAILECHGGTRKRRNQSKTTGTVSTESKRLADEFPERLPTELPNHPALAGRRRQTSRRRLKVASVADWSVVAGKSHEGGVNGFHRGLGRDLRALPRFSPGSRRRVGRQAG